MGSADTAPVVVGVDGSGAALRAARLAAREAARQQRPLHVVHAFIWPLLRVPVGRPPGAPPEAGLLPQAEQLLARVVDEARDCFDGLDVTGEIVDGQPAPVLIGQARRAALLVLGDRGLGPFTGLLVGSVPVQVSGYVDCPVLVDRGRAGASGPVVVGVDGSALSDRAIGFAAEQATLRAVELIAVHTYRRPRPTRAGDMLASMYDTDRLHDEQARALTESLTGWQTRYPQLRITRRLVRGRATTALIEESERAGLIVVGTLGRNSLSGLLLGSVSQALLHHSHCPVALVHP